MPHESNKRLRKLEQRCLSDKLVNYGCYQIVLVMTIWITGQISLVGKLERSLGGRVTKGNVYLDGNPICDNGWSLEDAMVACR